MTGRMFLGKHPAHGYAFESSRPGSDVLTCPDDELTFSSRFPLLQIIFSGVVDITSGSTETFTVPDFGFDPIVLPTDSLMSAMTGSVASFNIISAFNSQVRCAIRRLSRTSYQATVGTFNQGVWTPGAPAGSSPSMSIQYIGFYGG